MSTGRVISANPKQSPPSDSSAIVPRPRAAHRHAHNANVRRVTYSVSVSTSEV